MPHSHNTLFTLDIGYELTSLAIIDANGKDVKLINAGNNKYSFTMPNSAVIVTPTFKQSAPKTDPPTGEDGNGSISSSGNVTISSTSSGSVSISPKSPKKGDTVTITVKPDNEYSLKYLTIKDSNGKEITLTKVNDTTYTFTMPTGKVSVNPAFIKGEEKPSATVFTDVPEVCLLYRFRSLGCYE